MNLIYKQEIWLPTVQGWLVIFISVTVLILFLLTHIYPFLALNHPVKADILVVEGWMSDFGMKEVLCEFEKGSYQKLITIGPPLPEIHYLPRQYTNFAELGAATLITLGLAPNKVVAVPTPKVLKNRTYASAVALREWIEKSDLKVESINLYTFDVHSRRNWLLFKQVLAPKIKVGVITLAPCGYEPKHWWTSSAGVKSIIFETIAYIYARFLHGRA